MPSQHPKIGQNSSENTDRRVFLGNCVKGGTLVVGMGLSIAAYANKERIRGIFGHEHEDHPDPATLQRAKIAIRNQNRAAIANMMKPEGLDLTSLNQAQIDFLIRELDIIDACMDDGVVVENMHKFGIAGNASGYRGTELEEYVDRARRDRNFMRRLRRSLAHRRCAAQGGDDAAALRAAQDMAARFGLTEDRVWMAGFSDADDIRMRRDPHIHPAQGFVLDATGRFNEQALRLPVLKISTLHMPSSYVSSEVDIARGVIEGEEGMAGVLEPGDPTFVIITGRNRHEIDRIIREQSAMLDRFAKRPIDVPFIMPS